MVIWLKLFYIYDIEGATVFLKDPVYSF